MLPVMKRIIQGYQPWLKGTPYPVYEARLNRIPQVATDYVTIEDFSNPTGWSKGTAGTKDGESVLQFQPTATSSTNETTKKDYGGAFAGLADTKHWYFRVYVEGADKLAYLRLSFLDAAGVNGYGGVVNPQNNYTAVGGWSEGWNTICFHRDTLPVVGTAPGWDAIQQIWLRISKTGDIFPVCYFTEISFAEIRPLCTIWFDDGHKSVINTVYPKMATAGFAGATTLIGNMRYFNDGNDMDTADYTTLLGAGWDITNHAYTHTYLTQLSRGAIEKEIQKGIKACLDIGAGEAAYYFVPPGSKRNSNSIAIVNKCCTVSRQYGGNNLLPIADFMSLKLKEPLPATSVATVQGWIDEAILKGYWLILLFHKIDDTGSPGTYGVANFQGIIDYLVSKSADIDVVTPKVAINGMC